MRYKRTQRRSQNYGTEKGPESIKCENPVIVPAVSRICMARHSPAAAGEAEQSAISSPSQHRLSIQS